MAQLPIIIINMMKNRCGCSGLNGPVKHLVPDNKADSMPYDPPKENQGHQHNHESTGEHGRNNSNGTTKLG